MAALTAQVVAGFAPHLTPEQAVALAEQAILEGAALAPVLDDAAPGSEGLAKNPYWGYRVTRVADGTQGTVFAPKQLSGASTPEEVVHCVNTAALATSIVGRAVLRAWGYQLEFFQSKAPAPKPGTVLLPGD